MDFPFLDGRHRRRFEETDSVSKRILLVAASVLSAVLLWLAFPPVGWGWLAWIALVPLLLALRSVPQPRGGCLVGLVWGAVFYGVLLWWMQQFVARWTGSFWLGLAAWGALVLAQMLFAGVFGWGYVLLKSLSRTAALPIAYTTTLWVVIEFLRGAGSWGFLWGQLAVTQYRSPLTLQSAELLGAWGLSAWVMLANAAGAEAIARRRLRHLVVFAEVSLLLLLFGWWRMNLPAEPERVSAMVAQVNVDTTHHWTQQMQDQIKASMLRAINALTSERADLVLFSESLVPDATAYPFSDIIGRANTLGVTVLIGTFVEEEDKTYNTVTSFLPGVGSQSYRKQHLVPWGEYVPFRRWTPWVEHFGVVSADVSAGEHPILLTPWQIGTPICFESTLPRISCEMVRRGARLLCVVTNDTWFERSPAAEQHLAFCALRAVETRRWVLRSATTGISAVFDAQGRCVQRAELFEERRLRHEGVELRRDRTLYVLLGDKGAMGVLLALCVLLGFIERRKAD